ncbi:TAXI family TRAP transporter solute-binding subunit [Halorubrum sp. DTA98]|uniref:TAXI family TRAP transporter solute-binding subunit n=1 Tax=Halorubrum sp. DTA98 TaxID=3402163 RepID=UPI003AAA642A
MVQESDQYKSRRTVVKSLGVGIGSVAVAGCLGEDDVNGDGSAGGDGSTADDSSSDDGGSDTDTTWRFGTSTEGSGSGSLGPVFGAFFENNSDQLGISAQNTQGFVHNQRLLDAGELEIGFAHNIVTHWMYNEEGPFSEEPVDIRPVQGLPTIQNLNHCFVTRKENDIVEVPDLAGESVSLGPPGGAVPEIGERVLRAEGVWEDVETTRMGFTEAISAYRSEEISAFFTGIINMSTNPATVEAFETVDSDIVPMSDAGRDNLLSQYPFFEIAEIDTSHPMWSSALDTVHDTLTLPLLNSTAVMRRDLDRDTVYHAMETLHQNQEEMVDLNSVLWGYGFGTVEIEGEEVDRWGIRGQQADIPFHPGAADYLQEIDEWNDDFEIAN